MVSSLTAASIDTMLPALRQIGHDLGVANPLATQLVVTTFILGMVLGDLVFGPIADAIGRKKAILAGLAIYAAGSLIAGFAGSLDMLILGRVIQGIGVSGPKIASRALIRDRFAGSAMARILSLVFMVFILVPMIAPALGQLVTALAGWRAIFTGFLIWAALIALWLALRQPETLPPERRVPFRFVPLLRNATLIVRHTQVMALTIAAGAIFGAILLFVSTAQAIFLDLYAIDALFPACFALLAFGLGLSSFANSRTVVRLGMAPIARFGLIALTILGAALIATGLATSGRPPLWLFLALCFLCFSAFGLLFGNLNAMAMHHLARVAGLGASLISSISSLVAFLWATGFGRFYNATVFPLATGFVAAGVIGLLALHYAARSRAGEV
jgi:DHA1 family bicyclomycin/chloramphenicol resistance-like MFS transporter